MVRLGALLLLLFVGPVLAQQSDPLPEIRTCIKANFPDRSFHQHVRLISEDAAGGEQVLEAELFGLETTNDQINLMLSVEQPQDLAGARYLLLAKPDKDDMYVYLPALDRVRRVVGGMRGQPLWGTDFSYEDIKHLQVVLSDADVVYLGQGQRDQRALHQLQIKPLATAESAYEKIEIDLDAQTCLIAEARFFDAAGPSKRLSTAADAYFQVADRWVSGRVDMENLRSQTRSRLELSQVVYDQKLSRQLFNPKTFFMAR